MTSSPMPLSKWERQYSVLKHPVLGTKVLRVDCGSFWIILFGPFYLLFKKLWLKAGLFITLNLILGLIGTAMESSWPTILMLGTNLFLLFKTGRWVEADMVQSRGWQRLGICNAKSGEQALALIQSQPSESASTIQPPVQFKSSGIWQKIGMGLFITVGVVVVFLVAASLETKATTLPTCESATAESMVKDAVRNGPMNRVMNLELLALKNIETRESTTGPGKVVCVASALTNAGEQQIAYVFEWVNQEKGQYIVNVAPMGR